MLPVQIGSVPTPWPSWLIAAHPTRAPRAAVRTFLVQLTQYVRTFDTPVSRKGPGLEFIKSTFGYPEKDIKASRSFAFAGPRLLMLSDPSRHGLILLTIQRIAPPSPLGLSLTPSGTYTYTPITQILNNNSSEW